MQPLKSIHHVIAATSLLGCVAANAEDLGVFSKGLTGDTTYDKIWSAATLYKDEDNSILQEFSLQGRLQIQSIYGSDDGDSFNTSDYADSGAGPEEAVVGDDLEFRRAYFGFKSKWFRTWKFEGQIDVDTDGRDGAGGDTTFYKDIYDLYVVYAPSDSMNIGFGKQEFKFSREQEISSKEIVTLERSLVTNLLHPGNLTGIWASGKGIAGHWLYEGGLYAADQVREFSNFDAGAILLGKVGYDYSSEVGADTAVVSLRYMHNTNPGYRADNVDPNYSTPTSPAFTDAIAISNDITSGRFGLTTDILYGFGFTGNAQQNGVPVAVNQSDVFAINIIPSYFFGEGWQLVGRLQIAWAADPDGLRLPSRYERLVAGDDESGSTYLSGYLGVNYYFYSHKLKLMNGIEWSKLGGGDYDGYTAMTGLRMAF